MFQPFFHNFTYDLHSLGRSKPLQTSPFRKELGTDIEDKLIPPVTGNPYNGYINPFNNGKNWSLDPSTYSGI